jgi:hypothetical protein
MTYKMRRLKVGKKKIYAKLKESDPSGYGSIISVVLYKKDRSFKGGFKRISNIIPIKVANLILEEMGVVGIIRRSIPVSVKITKQLCSLTNEQIDLYNLTISLGKNYV